MAVHDKKMHANAIVARTPIRFIVESIPINQAAVLFGAIVPYQGMIPAEPAYGIYGWQVESVVVNQTAAVNTVQVDVQIGAVSVLTAPIIVLPGGIGLTGSLVAPALRRGRIADQLNMRVTSNGTGTASGLSVTVMIRPFPLTNEVG